MMIGRRDLLKSGTALGLSAVVARPVLAADIASGPFTPDWRSLVDGYQAPDWFRDAKFGIWAHWGPQAVPRKGDWYARFMYVPGHVPPGRTRL